MAKVTEYSRITKMKDNDILLVDGPDGTRTILQTDASKQMGAECETIAPHTYATIIEDGTDYDTLLTVGNYRCRSSNNAETMTNCPTSFGHVLVVQSTIASDRLIQNLQTSSASANIYRRYYNGSTWSNWRRLAYTSDIPSIDTTLSVSGDAADAKAVGELKTQLSAEDSFVNDALSYVNYGYDTPYYQPENPSGTWKTMAGIARDGQVIVLNKQNNPNAIIRIRLNGILDIAGTNELVAAWTNGIVLKDGHEYTATAKLIAGSSTYPDTNTVCVPRLLVYEAGTSTYSQDNARSTDGKTFTANFTGDATKTYNLVMIVEKTDMVLTNAKILVTLLDKTESKFVDLQAQIDEINDVLPEYYFENDYIAQKCNTINDIGVNIGREALRTVFFTDYHLEDNTRITPDLIDYIVNNTGIKSVIFGGDAMNHDYTSKTGGYKLLCNFLDDFGKVYEKTNMYMITGNHEMNNADRNHSAVELSKAVPYNLYNSPIFYKIKTQWQSGADTNTFYVDDDVNKMRFYCIDCTAGASILKKYLDVILPTFLTVPENYSVVVFSHTAIESYTEDTSTTPPTYTVTALTTTFDAIMQTGKAMNDGDNATISAVIAGNTYTWNLDFTGKARTFVGAIVGHVHFDSFYIYDNRFPVISVTCDTGAYRDTHPYRVAGTITEQAFDVVQIDVATQRIYMTRIGFGNDRTFSFGENAGLIS